VVDVSISMNAKDVAPTRLGAARSAIASFVDRVPRRVRIGLIAFADDPVVITAPTTDRAVLKAGIASLTPGFGTAITGAGVFAGGSRLAAEVPLLAKRMDRDAALPAESE